MSLAAKRSSKKHFQTALAKEKVARRLHDVASLQSGMPGQRIAKKNAWISPETAKKARIIFA